MAKVKSSHSGSHSHSPKVTPHESDNLWHSNIPFLAVLLLLGIGALSDSYWSWGISWLALFPIPWSITALIVAFLLILTPVGSLFGALVEKAHSGQKNSGTRSTHVLAFSLVSLSLFALFYFLRSRAPVYGDGYLILNSVSPSSELILEAQNRLQALSLILVRELASFLANMWSIQPINSLAMFNSLGGVVGFWAIYRMAGSLAKDWQRRLFLILTSLTSGAAILFFGYLENYTWATSLGLWTLYYSLEVAQGKSRILLLLLFSALSLAYHAITFPFVLVALAAIGMRQSREHKLFGILNLRQTIWVFTIGSFIVTAVTQASGFFKVLGLPHPFVPIWPMAGNSYLALSPAHLLDIMNLAFLLAPLGTMFILYLLASKQFKTDIADPKSQLLGLTVLLTCLASFWIDPLLGAPRDWDLLSFPGIPLSLWAGYQFVSARPTRSRVQSMILPLVALVLLTLGPNIYEKMNLQIAVERLDKLLWVAPQYQKDYDEAGRGLSWGTTLTEQLKRDDLSAKYFFRRLEAAPQSPSAWFNLGQIYSSRNIGDSAAICFENAVRYNPDNPRYLLKHVGALQKRGKFTEALPLIVRCEQLDPGNPTVQTNFGIVLYRLSREREALPHFQRAFDLAHGSVEEASNLGSAYFGLGLNDSACTYFTQAVKKGATAPKVFESLILAQLSLGRTNEAEATLAQFRTFSNQARDIDYYRSQLSRSPEKQQ